MEISLREVSVEFTGNVLIEPSKLALSAGHRYGLIGVSVKRDLKKSIDKR